MTRQRGFGVENHTAAFTERFVVLQGQWVLAPRFLGNHDIFPIIAVLLSIECHFVFSNRQFTCDSKGNSGKAPQEMGTQGKGLCG